MFVSLSGDVMTETLAGARTAAPRRTHISTSPPPGGASLAPFPLRLTRRGRALVTLSLAVMILLLGFAVGHASSTAAVPTPAPATVVVQPGETLWSLAARIDPSRDPRLVVGQLMAVNHLSDGTLQVGERIHLPA